MRHLWLVLLACSCGGVVVVDERNDGDDARDLGDANPPEDLSGPDDTTGGSSGDEAWAPPDAPRCIDDCGAWIGGCANDRVCVEPDAVCPGSAAASAHDLIACVCAGCAERCGGSCVMFDSENAACLECQQTMVVQTCSYEYFACTAP